MRRGNVRDWDVNENGPRERCLRVVIPRRLSGVHIHTLMHCVHSRLLAAVEVPLPLQKEACLEPAEASVVRISNTAIHKSATRQRLERGDIIVCAAILIRARPRLFSDNLATIPRTIPRTIHIYTSKGILRPRVSLPRPRDIPRNNSRTGEAGDTPEVKGYSRPRSVGHDNRSLDERSLSLLKGFEKISLKIPQTILKPAGEAPGLCISVIENFKSLALAL